MKGKEIRKEKKTEKKNDSAVKVHSDYQNAKTRKSIPDAIVSSKTKK